MSMPKIRHVRPIAYNCGAPCDAEIAAGHHLPARRYAPSQMRQLPYHFTPCLLLDVQLCVFLPLKLSCTLSLQA